MVFFSLLNSLFETSQSLFWASFGLVDLESFELTGIKGFTRFWGLLMFGSYSMINIIVLLNMLIAMMSNSYQVIQVIQSNSMTTISIQQSSQRIPNKSNNLLKYSKTTLLFMSGEDYVELTTLYNYVIDLPVPIGWMVMVDGGWMIQQNHILNSR